MKNTPINYKIVNQKVQESGVAQVGSASIREIKKLVDQIEKASGEKFIRMEMGIPGLPASQYGVKAQIKALEDGVASIYPDIQGIPQLKNEISRFVRKTSGMWMSIPKAAYLQWVVCRRWICCFYDALKNS